MAFKFFTSRIVTAPISLQDALANAAKALETMTVLVGDIQADIKKALEAKKEK